MSALKRPPCQPRKIHNPYLLAYNCTCTGLRRLDLSNNDITDEGFEVLALALKSPQAPPSLELLDLSGKCQHVQSELRLH